jgi:predicted Fe-Mo cluster-binding NifX family protein
LNKTRTNPKTIKGRQPHRIAVATETHEGLDDVISQVFGRANTFTIIEVAKGEIKDVRVLENPATSYKYGAGPIVAKTLVDAGVDTVIAPDLGQGVSTLLEQHNIAIRQAQPGISVKKSIQTILGETAIHIE